MNATERRAREAQRRGKRAGNAGQPAVGAREVRAGLAELGWREDGGAPALYRTLAARLVARLPCSKPSRAERSTACGCSTTRNAMSPSPIVVTCTRSAG